MHKQNNHIRPVNNLKKCQHIKKQTSSTKIKNIEITKHEPNIKNSTELIHNLQKIRIIENAAFHVINMYTNITVQKKINIMLDELKIQNANTKVVTRIV